MTELLKGAFAAISAVKGPLTFWAFIAVIALGALLVVMSKPKLIETLARLTGRSVGKTQFYRLVRLSLWFLFSLALLTIVMTFVAPLALQMMGEVGGRLSRDVLAAEGRILGSIEQDRKLARALDLFERHEYEAAHSVLADVLAASDRRPGGFLQGHIVATYFGAGDFAGAAREVLRRDRSLRPGDTSLWPDLAWCLRKYTLKNSLPAAIELVDTLRKEFGPKLVSPVWTVLPVEIVGPLRKGTHSRMLEWMMTEEQQRDIDFVIRSFPNAPFVDFALYARGRYQEAERRVPGSLIKDVLAYAQAHILLMTKVRDEETGEITGDLTSRSDVRRRLWAFVEDYPRSPHADDAAVWLGWIATKEGKVSEALGWFRRSTSLGNKDDEYRAIAARFEKELLANLRPAVLRAILEEPISIASAPYWWYVLARREHFGHRFQAAREIATSGLARIPVRDSARSNPESPEYEFDPDDHYRERLRYFIEAADSMSALNQAATASHLRQGGNLFRKHFRDYVTAAYVYDEGIRRFPGSPEADNMLFLKVLVYRDWEPDSVKPTVAALLRRFPNSEFADDAFAELAFVQLAIQGETEAGAATVRRLLQDYPSGNARDNALNWLALRYAQVGNTGKARQTYMEIVQRFPTTRFADYARTALAGL